jgi:hypothetical protein
LRPAWQLFTRIRSSADLDEQQKRAILVTLRHYPEPHEIALESNWLAMRGKTDPGWVIWIAPETDGH